MQQQSQEESQPEWLDMFDCQDNVLLDPMHHICYTITWLPILEASLQSGHLETKSFMALYIDVVACFGNDHSKSSPTMYHHPPIQ